jgi:Ca-activated chloride channel family protein
MSLTWPWALAALLAFPLLWGIRWWLRRRRRRDAVVVWSVAMIRAALPGPSAWWRRVPVWLFATGMVVLAVGAARPQGSVLVPSESSAILLVIDVSGSMCSTDVPPNRLTVAQGAARDFVAAQQEGTKIGLVAFAGHSSIVVKPTGDKQALTDAIGTLRTARGTAIGLGILSAIDAIAEINPDVPPTGVELPMLEGSTMDFLPDTIVVLTDGANTQGVDPVTAAGEAAARRLRVFTIGFGTTDPAPFVCTAEQLSPGSPFGGGAGGGGGGWGGGGGSDPSGRARYQQLDEAALTEVATVTGGAYYQAQDAQALTDVLLDLPSVISLQRRDVELTVWFAFAGALLITAAVGLSQWWHRPRRSPASG